MTPNPPPQHHKCSLSALAGVFFSYLRHLFRTFPQIACFYLTHLFLIILIFSFNTPAFSHAISIHDSQLRISAEQGGVPIEWIIAHLPAVAANHPATGQRLERRAETLFFLNGERQSAEHNPFLLHITPPDFSNRTAAHWQLIHIGHEPLHDITIDIIIDLELFELNNGFDDEILRQAPAQYPQPSDPNDRSVNLPSTDFLQQHRPAPGYLAYPALRLLAGEPGYHGGELQAHSRQNSTSNHLNADQQDDHAASFRYFLPLIEANETLYISLYSSSDPELAGLSQHDRNQRKVYQNSVLWQHQSHPAPQGTHIIPHAPSPNPASATQQPSARPIPALPASLVVILALTLALSTVHHKRIRNIRPRASNLAIPLALLASLMLPAAPARAGYWQGGSVEQQQHADVVADIVFTIDTSGSMGAAIHRISDILEDTVHNLQCSDATLWLRARFLGMGSVNIGWFNENIRNVTGQSLSDDQYQRAPYLLAQHYSFEQAPAGQSAEPLLAHQAHVKAIVSIGDGGNTGNSADLHHHLLSNQSAILHNILLFTIHQENDNGCDTAGKMRVMSEGGEYTERCANANQHQTFLFSNTGGSFHRFSRQFLQDERQGVKASLEAVLCRAARHALRHKPCVPNFSARAKFGKVQLSWQSAPNQSIHIERLIDQDHYDPDSPNWQRLTHPAIPASLTAEQTPHTQYFIDHTLNHPSLENQNLYYRLRALNSKQETRCLSAPQLIYSPHHIADARHHRAPLITSRIEAHSSPDPDGMPSFSILDELRYPLSARDPEGEAIHFELLHAPKDAKLINNQLHWQPQRDQYASFVISARDARGAKSSQSFTLHAIDPPPRIISPPPSTKIGLGWWRYPLHAEDPNDRRLIYSQISELPIHNICNQYPSPRRCQGTGEQHGPVWEWHVQKQPDTPASVTFLAADISGGQDQQRLDFTILNNHPPKLQSAQHASLQSGANQRLIIGETWQPQWIAEDREGDPITYQLDPRRSLSALHIDPHTGRLSPFTPSADQLGRHQLNLELHDPYSFSKHQLNLHIVTPNTPPTISPSAQSINILQGHQRNFSFTVHEADMASNNDEIRCQLDGTPPSGMHITLNRPQTQQQNTYTCSGKLRISPDLPAGHYSQRLIARDYDHDQIIAEDSFADHTLHITVAPNQPPIIDAPSRLSIPAGETWQLDVRVYDPDGDLHSLRAHKPPRGFTQTSQRREQNTILYTFRWTPSVEQIGEHSFELRAHDRGSVDLNHVHHPITFTVHDPANPPAEPLRITSALPNPTTLIAGQPWQHHITAHDPLSRPLIYSLIDPPTGMHIDPHSGIINWTPSFEHIGEHSITVTVNLEDEPDIEAATQSFTITVQAPAPIPNNTLPTITSGEQDFKLSDDHRIWRYSIRAEDPDLERGDRLQFGLIDPPAGMRLEQRSATTAEIIWQIQDEHYEQNINFTVWVMDLSKAGYLQEIQLTITRPNTTDPADPSDPAVPSDPAPEVQAAIERACAWLKQQRQSDGSIQSIDAIATPTQSTHEAINACPELEPNSRHYLLHAQNEHLEYLSRKLVYLKRHHLEHQETQKQLNRYYHDITYTQPSRGYSSYPDYPIVSVIDSAYALIADEQGEHVSPTLLMLINQTPDTPYTASMVLRAYRHHQEHYPLSSYIQNLSEQLQQQSVHELWLKAHITQSIAADLSPQPLRARLEQLLAQQQPDGSFANDSWTTAHAIQAIKSLTTRMTP